MRIIRLGWIDHEAAEHPLVKALGSAEFRAEVVAGILERNPRARRVSVTRNARNVGPLSFRKGAELGQDCLEVIGGESTGRTDVHGRLLESQFQEDVDADGSVKVGV